MSYNRPTLSEIKARISQDIADSGSLLRFSNLAIIGQALANLSNLEYGYLDNIALQCTPFTATDANLEAWAALKNVYRETPNSATGQVTFYGASGTSIPTNSKLARSDGKLFTVTTGATADGMGNIVVSAQADADPEGLYGAFGNTSIGGQMALAVGIDGVNPIGLVSTAFVGGADLETDDALRARMLQAYQNQPQGGGKSDYDTWMLQVNGVTRSWVNPNGMGAGTVVCYFMMDVVNASFGGFPQGDNGVSENETRSAYTATGDQLTVANHLYDLQPVTALVYACAPIATSKNFTITGIDTASRDAVKNAISDVFFRSANPIDGIVHLAEIWSAIESAAGSSDFLINSPTVDITFDTGHLPILGTVTWA